MRGIRFHGFAPTAPVRSSSRIAGRSRISTGSSNRVLSSAAHAGRKPAGTRISARSTRPRARSSASTSPAWIVLPSPTASASSSRVTPPSTARAGASCHGNTSIPATGAAHSTRSGRARDSACSVPRMTASRRRRAGGRSVAGSRRSNGTRRVAARCGFAASAASRVTMAPRASGRVRRTCHRSPRAHTRAPGTRADRTSSIAVTLQGAQELRGSRVLALQRRGQGKDDARPKKKPLQRSAEAAQRWSGEEAMGLSGPTA